MLTGMIKAYPTGKQRPPKERLQATVDVVLFTLSDDALKVVLIERKHDPLAGGVALPGGFIWHGETAQQTAERVLATKAGIAAAYMEQLFTFDAVDRDSRGRIISIAYMALVPAHKLRFEDGPYIETPALYDVRSRPKLSFDHDEILRYGVKRLGSKLAYTNIAYSLLPEQFTLTQLQRLYELVLDRDLDKRNFRKKYLTLGVIEPTAGQSAGGRHRPAQLYRFKTMQPFELSEPVL
jgi:8-oxo-dGTP diphosphatase